MSGTQEPPAVECPFCHSHETELIALFGSQMLTSQYYCRSCHTSFEAVKWNDKSGLQKDKPRE